MRKLRVRAGVFAVLGTGLLAAAIVATSAPAGTSGTATVQKVKVTMKEFKFVLKPKTVKKGTVVFTVVNAGTIRHDFKIARKKTALLAPGKRATLRVTFKKAGRYPYRCTVPGHALAGMKGVLVVK